MKRKSRRMSFVPPSPPLLGYDYGRYKGNYAEIDEQVGGFIKLRGGRGEEEEGSGEMVVQFPVVDVQEKVLGKRGISAACPYCGGPVFAWDIDSHTLFCFIPISHKSKKKFYCAICSKRLVPSTSTR